VQCRKKVARSIPEIWSPVLVAFGSVAIPRYFDMPLPFHDIVSLISIVLKNIQSETITALRPVRVTPVWQNKIAVTE